MKIIGRYVCCASLALLGALPVFSQQTFTLEGTLKDLPVLPSRLYLIYDTISGKAADSAAVVKGKYKFTGTLSEPTYVTISPKISVKDVDPRNFASFFLDKGTQKAVSSGYIHNIKIDGSNAAKDFIAANKRLQLIADSTTTLSALYRETQDRFYFDQVFMSTKDIYKPLIESYTDFIRRNTASPINPYLINVITGGLYKAAPGTADSVMALFERMPTSVKNGITAKKTLNNLRAELQLAIGHKAPEFNLPSADRENVSLSSLKGKYVMIYFQSGNTPPGVEQTYMANAWQTYRDKGFTLVCISVDADQPSKYPWINLLGNAQVKATYGSGNFLLDPAGNIIARNLSGSDIDHTLSYMID